MSSKKQAQQALGLHPWTPSESSEKGDSAAEKAGKRLMGFGKGFKRMVGRAGSEDDKNQQSSVEPLKSRQCLTHSNCLQTSGAHAVLTCASYQKFVFSNSAVCSLWHLKSVPRSEPANFARDVSYLETHSCEHAEKAACSYQNCLRVSYSEHGEVCPCGHCSAGSSAEKRQRRSQRCTQTAKAKSLQDASPLHRLCTRPLHLRPKRPLTAPKASGAASKQQRQITLRTSLDCKQRARHQNCVLFLRACCRAQHTTFSFGLQQPITATLTCRSPFTLPEKGETASGDSPRASNFFGRAKDRLRKGLGREKDRVELEEADLEQLKELAALEESVALALAAFAIQAYLKSVMCPSLSDYTPRATAVHPRVRDLPPDESFSLMFTLNT